MEFKEVQIKVCDGLKKLDQQSLDFAKKLLAYSSVLEKTYQSQFKEFLNTYQVQQYLYVCSETAGTMIKELDAYDIQGKQIKVKLGTENLINDLIDLPSFIKQKFSPKSEEDYLLILSYLLRQENFELMQITECILAAEAVEVVLDS